jgi:multisubunit Na+/H+ antiporter MnhC subunit
MSPSSYLIEWVLASPSFCPSGGAAKIAHGLKSLESNLLGLIREKVDPIEPFRGMGNAAAPTVLTVGTVIVFAGQSVVQHDSWPRGIVTGGAWLLSGIALWTFVWVYLNLQIGLNRFGRFPLSLQTYPEDRSLGLRPIGRLAFTGFWTFIVLVSSLVLSAAANQLGLIIGLLILSVGVALFFLSLRRLNRQMVAAKQREVTRAQHLYAEAFEPVREAGTLEALLGQSGALSAAEALEKRAERIQEWPFDEATFARVVTISSTVVAAIVARVLLAPFDI